MKDGARTVFVALCRSRISVSRLFAGGHAFRAVRRCGSGCRDQLGRESRPSIAASSASAVDRVLAPAEFDVVHTGHPNNRGHSMRYIDRELHAGVLPPPLRTDSPSSRLQ